MPMLKVPVAKELVLVSAAKVLVVKVPVLVSAAKVPRPPG
jgi:hypothetical protein